MQPPRFVVDDLRGALSRFGVRRDAISNRLREALDARQRRAQIMRDVRQKIALGLLRRGDLGRHVVERVRQRADLGRAANRCALRIIAARDAPCRPADLLQGPGDGARDQRGQQQRRQQRHRRRAHQRREEGVPERFKDLLQRRARHRRSDRHRRTQITSAQDQRLRDKQPLAAVRVEKAPLTDHRPNAAGRGEQDLAFHNPRLAVRRVRTGGIVQHAIVR